MLGRMLGRQSRAPRQLTHTFVARHCTTFYGKLFEANRFHCARSYLATKWELGERISRSFAGELTSCEMGHVIMGSEGYGASRSRASARASAAEVCCREP